MQFLRKKLHAWLQVDLCKWYQIRLNLSAFFYQLRTFKTGKNETDKLYLNCSRIQQLLEQRLTYLFPILYEFEKIKVFYSPSFTDLVLTKTRPSGYRRRYLFKTVKWCSLPPRPFSKYVSGCHNMSGSSPLKVTDSFMPANANLGSFQYWRKYISIEYSLEAIIVADYRRRIFLDYSYQTSVD